MPIRFPVLSPETEQPATEKTTQVAAALQRTA